MSSQAPDAGWYPQPDGSQRYWDGSGWTPHVAVHAPLTPAAPTTPVAAPQKSPGLSLLVSFFLPGVGTMINGQVGRGLGILAGWFVAFVLGPVGYVLTASVYAGVLLLAALVLWIWGMVDAYQGAQKWNAAHGIRS